jgi:GT2 family glycosyltransferase
VTVHPLPSVSVVIPVRNASSTLAEQFTALSHQTYRGLWQVVVADNGSTDGSIEIAGRSRADLPDVVVVDASQRRGQAHARNVGAAHARGELLLFCDADDVVADGWIEALVEALGSFDMVGGRLQLDLLNGPDAYTPPNLPSTGLPGADGFLPYVISANCGIRASVFSAVGGFDESFVGCTEDVDLSWRVQLASYSLGFAPAAVVHYRLRQSARDLARQCFRYGVVGAHLYKKFRGHPIARPDPGSVLHIWLFILTRWFHVFRRPSLRWNWVAHASFRTGCLIGGLRYGLLYW